MEDPMRRVALVTGATSGMGLEIASRLARRGDAVHLCARDADAVAATVKALQDEGLAVDGQSCDVTDRAQIRQLVGGALDRFGRIDVLVNNAGRSGGGPTAELDDDLWFDVINTNLNSVFLVTKAVLTEGGMLARGTGRVINIASTGGKQGVVFADRRLRLLQTALLFEQAAILATTAHLIGLLVSREVSLGVAAAALGVMGVGKVLGRLLLLGPTGRLPLARLAGAVNLVQLVGLAIPLVSTTTEALFPAMVVVGAASGATTVLRPLLVVELVGAGPFAAVSARLQRATTIARSAAPFVVGGIVSVGGWTAAWSLCLVAFAVAAERYVALDPQWSLTSGRGATIRRWRGARRSPRSRHVGRR